MAVAKITEVTFTSPDRVRDVIHNFNADSFDSLYPKYKGGRPRTFTLPERREIKKPRPSQPARGHDQRGHRRPHPRRRQPCTRRPRTRPARRARRRGPHFHDAHPRTRRRLPPSRPERPRRAERHHLPPARTHWRRGLRLLRRHRMLHGRPPAPRRSNRPSMARRRTGHPRAVAQPRLHSPRGSAHRPLSPGWQNCMHTLANPRP
nr:hypothetical protein [Streptomyces sp. MZ04]